MHPHRFEKIAVGGFSDSYTTAEQSKWRPEERSAYGAGRNAAAKTLGTAALSVYGAKAIPKHPIASALGAMAGAMDGDTPQSMLQGAVQGALSGAAVTRMGGTFSRPLVGVAQKFLPGSSGFASRFPRISRFIGGVRDFVAGSPGYSAAASVVGAGTPDAGP